MKIQIRFHSTTIFLLPMQAAVRTGLFIPLLSMLALVALPLLAATASAATDIPANPPAAGPGPDEATSDDDMVEVQAKADPRLLEKPWNKVPFDQTPFTYSREEVVRNWPQFSRGLRVPLPTIKRLKPLYDRVKDKPQMRAEIARSGFNGDFRALEARLYDQGTLFLRGDFREARLAGEDNPPTGKIIGMLSQLIYAIYLADTQKEKHSMLQEVVDEANRYQWLIDDLKNEPELNDYVAAFELGSAYAIARIAEEQPSRVVIARGYVNKIRSASEEVLQRVPDHPMGLAFRAGLDAGIMRRVGKMAGRITFGARQTTAIDYFEKSIALQPDIAITRYEYGNALLYISKRRALDDAIEQIRLASKQKPNFAMEALDAMYAAKRVTELEDLKKSGISFRAWERARRRFQKESGINMTSVLKPPFLVTRYLKEDVAKPAAGTPPG